MMKITNLFHSILFILIVLTVVACGGGGTSTPKDDNTQPVANAGLDQVVTLGDVVNLEGDQSNDADNDELTYSWEIQSAPDGSQAVLINETTESPEIQPDLNGEYVIQLIVNDSKINSAVDTVTITVESVSSNNTAPIANAGADQSVVLGSEVILDGGVSSDIDGDSLSYQWNLLSSPENSTATLNNGGTQQPTITPDLIGTYTFELIVNDGSLPSVEDVVVVNVSAVAETNNAPIADAGGNINALLGETIILDGAASSDPDGDQLQFQWQLVSEPEGSSLTLENGATAQASFTPAVSGAYVFQLVVNDGKLDSAPDVVNVNIITPNTQNPITLNITTPKSLVTVGESPVTVEGVISPSTAVLTINGVEISHTGGAFSADVTLEEGLNTVVARGVLLNYQQTDSIAVALDRTPPYITIESHKNNQTVYTEKVTVTGLINDIVRGTVEAEQATVSINGISGDIANRSYSVTEVLLVPGSNLLKVTGVDLVGNISEKSFTLNYEVPSGKRIELSSGDNQSNTIENLLAEPLTIKVIDENGDPLSNESVVFRVTQGSGALKTDSTEDRAVIVETSDQGLASVNYRLGIRVGTANQKVSATIVGYDTTVTFNASATGKLGDKISINSGNNQRGAVFQILPAPLVAIVSDSGANVVKGARVKFEIITGNGKFDNEETTIELLTDSDGRVYAEYILGTTPGIDAQRIKATLLDTESGDPLSATFTATAFVPGNAGNTSISGVVLDNQDKPLPGVSIHVKGTTRTAIADSEGRFKITETPIGPVQLIVDGSTALADGEYPTLKFNLVTVAGVENPLYQPINMVRLTDSNIVYAGLEDAVVNMVEFPGFSLEILKNSVTFPGGAREGYVSVTPVNSNKVPMAPPNGSQPQFIITVQPSGTMFDPPARLTVPNVDGLKPGVQTEVYSYDHDLEEFVAIGLGTVSEDGSSIVSNPGVGIIKAGWGFVLAPPSGTGGVLGGVGTGPGPVDPPPEDEPGFFDNIVDFIEDTRDALDNCSGNFICDKLNSAEDYARGVVDEAGQLIDDAAQIVSDVAKNVIDETTGLVKGVDALLEENFPKYGEYKEKAFEYAQKGADPIIMSTGELEYTQTDLEIVGRGFNFQLNRTYRSRLHFNGRLGYNWVFNYHQLLDVPESSAENQDIVRSMEDGRQYTYTENEGGSYKSPDNIFDVLTKNPDNSFTIRQSNGFKTHFNAQGLMSNKVDRFGNTMSFEYDEQDRLVKVIDTLGRDIIFSYRSDSGHIDTVTDFSGRSVRYFYDENRDLVAVRTPIISGTPNGNDFTQGKYTYYTYSSGFDESGDSRLKNVNHNLLTATDAQGNVYIENVYNNNPNSYQFDKITQQRFGVDSQRFTLIYEQLNAEATEITPGLPLNRTTMIDRNGNRHEYIHNVGGMLLDEKNYTNRDVVSEDPDFFVTTFTYDVDGLLLSKTNPEGDNIEYLYDSTNSLRYMQRNLLSTTYTPDVRGAEQPQLIEVFAYEPIYNQIRLVTNRRAYTTFNTYDYQHADNLALLAQELGISEAEVSTIISAAGMSLEGGVSGQISGNIIRIDSPDATLPDGSSQQTYLTRSYNRFSQMIEEIDAEGIVTQYEYYAEKDPDGNGTVTESNRTLSIDTGGFLKAVIRDVRIDTKRTRPGPALAIRTQTKYDIVGNKIEVVDGRGNSSKFIYNQLNQLVRSISAEPFEYLTDYYYDANNNLVRTSRQNISTTGPNLSGFVHTIYRYNSLNDRVSEILIPESGVTLETTYEYDANQNLVAIQQAEGNRVERVYDERDLVVQITQGAGTDEAAVRTMRYDGNRNLISETDAEDNDGDGNPETTTFTYDGYNRLVQSTDADGNRTAYLYDANSNKVRERHYGSSGIPGIDNTILLADTTAHFDEQDRVYQRDDSLLVNGLPQNVGAGLTPDDNKVTGVQWYDRLGLIVRSVDDNGNAATTVYDGLHRPISVTDVNGNSTTTIYDKNSNVTQIGVTQISVEERVADKTITSTFTYDELNRKSSETNALGNTNSYRYDSRNNLIQTADALGNIKLYIYDGVNRLLESREYLATDGVGTGSLDATNPTNRDGIISVFYNYDKNSRLVSQTDDNGNTTQYSYDNLNRKTKITYADETTVSVVFDKDSNVTSKTDQNSSVFTYSYDVLNRLKETSVVPADGVVGSTAWTYTYDGFSRRISATDNNDPSLFTDDSTVEYRYNSFNYLLSETNNGKVTTANYDGLGIRKTLTYSSGRVLNYNYDNIYNLKAIRDDEANDANANIVEYDYAGSRVLERRYANGTKLSYIDESSDVGFDGINRVVQHRHSTAENQLIAGFEYAYDKANNRRFEIDQFTQLADVYEYDSAYRLVRAAYRVPAANDDLQAIDNNETVNTDVSTIISPEDSTYLMDGVGNWVSQQTIEENISKAVGYQVNAMNEYERIGANEQSHDDNGNLLGDNEKNYFYDARNRLVRVTTLGGNTIATYKYDAFDRRIEKRAGSETIRYVHFGKQVLEEHNALDQLQRQYVYGNGVDEVLQLRNASNDEFYYHDNSVGSVVALTDNEGAVIERYDYNAYGVTSVFEADGVTPRLESVVGNRYGFTGRRYDAETGFYYYRARYYAPERGRFIQRDPLGYTDGMGVYAYVGNNPINFVDPSGMLAKQAAEWTSKHADTILDGIQIGLDVAGMIPVVGNIADLANAGISALRGDAIGVAASLAAAVPGAGLLAGAGKLCARLCAKAVGLAKAAAKGVGNIGASAANKVGSLMNAGANAVSGMAKRLGDKINAGRAKGVCCFVAGTKVLTEFGYKNIEEIELGELVYSKDVENDISDWKPVTHLFEKYRRVLEVTVVDEQGQEKSIETTDDHPFYVVGNGWVGAEELQPNDEIEADESSVVHVSSVVDSGRYDTVYNIEVADFHTYYATELGLLVHNDCLSDRVPEVSTKNDGYSIQGSISNDKNAWVRAETNAPGVVELTDVFRGGLPKGSAGEFVAKTLKAQDAIPTEKFIIKNIENAPTANFINGGGRVSESVLGKTGLSALNHMGLEASNVSSQIVRGKLQLTFDIKK